MCTERSPVGHWRHRLRNTGSAEAKRQQKKGHLTKTHFTPSGTHERSVRPTRRQRPHVHSAQRQFRFLCSCLAVCKTRCSSLSRQTSQSNHIIHHIFRSLGFQNIMLGWVITETETNYEDKFHSVNIRWFLSPPVVEFSWSWLQPSASGTGPELYFEDSMVPFRMHIYVDFKLLCAKQRSRQSDEQRTLWPTRWQCLLLFMQSRLHRHRSQSQRWQSFCFVFQNSAVGHVA